MAFDFLRRTNPCVFLSNHGPWLLIVDCNRRGGIMVARGC